jgi:excisionase family DNA binding protein
VKTITTLKTANASLFLTVEEAASELDINKQTVRDYLTKGKIKTYKFKTLTLVSAKEINELKNGRSKQ